MSFDPSKCHVLRVTRKLNKLTANYFVRERKLNFVDISKNLSWKTTIIDFITVKANHTLYFLQRNLIHCPEGFEGDELQVNR